MFALSDSSIPTKVTTGPRVTMILDYMFYGSGIQSITHPASVTGIGMKAFQNSTLTYVTSLATTAPTLGGDGLPFNHDVWQDIYIPSGSRSSYVSKWSAYQIRLIEQ